MAKKSQLKYAEQCGIEKRLLMVQDELDRSRETALETLRGLLEMAKDRGDLDVAASIEDAIDRVPTKCTRCGERFDEQTGFDECSSCGATWTPILRRVL